MKNKFGVTVAICALFLAVCLLLPALSFGQEMPAAGEVIDKTNYMKYKHLFPEQILPGFENGLDGFFKPFTMKVVDTRFSSLPRSFLAFSQKNKGKYSIDTAGAITGGYDYVGLPFPGLTKFDKDFATKLAYNYTYKYYVDDYVGPAFDCEKRKGEHITNVAFDSTILSFIGRLVNNPKPTLSSPVNLQWAQTFFYTYPFSQRSFQILSYRYLDPKKSDETYTYIPSMRKVIRGDASQRSTPIQGTTQSYDDFNGGFDAKVQDFTYNFLGEKKVLASLTSPMNIALIKKLQEQGGGYLPMPSDNWEVRDTYVIEILPKDPRYPQSRKIIYLDKENLRIHYAIAWDKGGRLWKIWMSAQKTYSLPNGDQSQFNAWQLGIDVQFRYASSFTMEGKYYGNNLTYTDVLPSIMTKRGQ